ncbi:hypothetical protein KAR91_52065 [Candidatus Pacearchaeota archaeon]|nr:hypothetical protein [Candidatus Pacearchaeota archaeon]
MEIKQNLTVTKDYKGIIDEGWRYKIEGSLVAEGHLEFKLNKPVYVTGGIEAGCGIEAGLSITCSGLDKCTKGEWRYSPTFGDITFSDVGILEGTKRIATCSNFSKTDEETAANGTLMAASKDMYLSLKTVKQAIEKGDPQDIVDVVNNEIKLAIEKAERG